MDNDGDVECPRGSETGGLGGGKNYNRRSVADGRHGSERLWSYGLGKTRQGKTRQAMAMSRVREDRVRWETGDRQSEAWQHC